MTIGWNFPLKGDDGFDGFKGPGVETYRGTPFQSLAREVLQNSLDARAPDAKGPVTVVFEVMEIERDKFPGIDEFRKTLKKCLDECYDGEEKERYFFNNALNILKRKRITCLRIEDHNTTGLLGEPSDRKSLWYAMTKTTGRTVKSSKGAGGSFGIGKNAPFVVSDLRTVFYYTRYPKNGCDVERVQGKSILMSHKDGANTAQGTGYYGVIEGCLPVNKGKIPAFIRRNEKKSKSYGTTLVIPGFTGGENWQNIIKSAVLSNFFCAVHNGNLEVIIEFERAKDMICIEKDNLVQMFKDMLPSTGSSSRTDEDAEKLADASRYLSAIIDGERRSSEQQLLGNCELYMQVEEGLPKKVGIVRETGMLITDEMLGLKRFPQCRDFVGILICRNTKGNMLLRDMENPQHNAFEPSRMSAPDEVRKGKKALDDLASWVREWVKTIAGAPTTSGSVALDELKNYIPDQDNDNLPGEGSENQESNIEGNFLITPKRPPSEPQKVSNKDDEEETGGGEPDGSGNGGGGNGVREGPDNIYAARKQFQIKNLRILPLQPYRKRVLFTPEKSGEALLSLEIAGDSMLERLTIEKIEDKDGRMAEKINNSTFFLSLTANERTELVVTLGENISHALVLRVYEKDQPLNNT